MSISPPPIGSLIAISKLRSYFACSSLREYERWLAGDILYASDLLTASNESYQGLFMVIGCRTDCFCSSMGMNVTLVCLLMEQGPRWIEYTQFSCFDVISSPT